MSLGVRGIDTAYNYGGFTSHRMLASVASDLLGQFTLSTKVGFFPARGAGGRAVHSLEPNRLREAVEQSADQLGRCPDVVFLHNPERTLSEQPIRAGGDQLVAACAALADVVKEGLCGQWGISSWDPHSVVTVLNAGVGVIEPDVLLLRAGLSIADSVLVAGDELSRQVGISPRQRWGMSPFGGSTRDTVWSKVDLDVFLAQGQQATTCQAAFRLAYELPPVTCIAVGTTNAQHLEELVAATTLTVNGTVIRRYRRLIA
ncbi:aldo/keto reductase [Kibdelosporangium lantanae]|uniref:Aldo/keto reductase n=1 Tax=Kibdelosporangium lantanae TaxID=1497396 RepID=A0ABW3MC84_9PSEU